MSNDIEIAQALRRSHCENQKKRHDCVGVCTITPERILLTCTICGDGDVGPRNLDPSQVEYASRILTAAGVSWDHLSIETQRAVVAATTRR